MRAKKGNMDCKTVILTLNSIFTTSGDDIC